MMLKDKKSFYKGYFDSIQVRIVVWDFNNKIVLANILTSKIFNY
tara:strand:+ start:4233 stop:4364 length:132 start_codon:yes stop_codon:yes gene_type:complete